MSVFSNFFFLLHLLHGLILGQSPDLETFSVCCRTAVELLSATVYFCVRGLESCFLGVIPAFLRALPPGGVLVFSASNIYYSLNFVSLLSEEFSEDKRVLKFLLSASLPAWSTEWAEGTQPRNPLRLLSTGCRRQCTFVSGNQNLVSSASYQPSYGPCRRGTG